MRKRTQTGPGWFPNPSWLRLIIDPFSGEECQIHIPHCIHIEFSASFICHWVHTLPICGAPAILPALDAHISSQQKCYFSPLQDPSSKTFLRISKCVFIGNLNIPTSRKVNSLFFLKPLEGGIATYILKTKPTCFIISLASSQCSGLLQHRQLPTRLPISSGSPLHQY